MGAHRPILPSRVQAPFQRGTNLKIIENMSVLILLLLSEKSPALDQSVGLA